jgi:hypothetical protein
MKGNKVTFNIYGKTITGVVTDYSEKDNYISINNDDYRMTIDYFKTIQQ